MMSEKERIKHDKNKSWQVWTLATDKAVYYEVQDGRSMKAAEKLLGDYHGIILCDGYAVYEALAGRKPKIILAFCWSHVRRKYKNIKEFFPKTRRRLSVLSTSFSRSIGEPRATMLRPCRNARIFAIHCLVQPLTRSSSGRLTSRHYQRVALRMRSRT